MDVSPKPPSRLRFIIHYDDSLVPLEEVIQLGESYESWNYTEETPQMYEELFKYKHGQSASWADVPLELRLMIYKYAYASPPRPYRGYHMNIYSGRRYRIKYGDSFKDLSLNDDDIVVQFPHLLADRCISKQWLFETADTISKLPDWHLHVEDITWDWAIRLFERKSISMETVEELGQTIAAIMLQHISIMYMYVNTGNKISDSFKMEHFEFFKSLDYFQMHHDDWWENQYWINNQSSDSDDELQLVSIQNAKTDTDDSAVAMVRQNIHTLTRETADALKKRYEEGIYEDGGLHRNMRESIFKWSAQNDAFKDLRNMFDEWTGPKRTYPSELMIRAFCGIQGSPEQLLRFDLWIETCNRLLVRVVEQESKIYKAEEETEEEATIAITEQQQQQQESAEQESAEQPPPLRVTATATANEEQNAATNTAQTIPQAEITTEQQPTGGNTTGFPSVTESSTEEPAGGAAQRLEPEVAGH